MWAVVVTVDVPAGMDAATARKGIEQDLVPGAPSMPGFVRAVWMAHSDGGTGLGIHHVQGEQDARQIAGQITVGADAGAGATVRSVDVYEVLAEA